MTTFNLSALNSSIPSDSIIPPSRSRAESACSDTHSIKETEPERGFSIREIPHLYENCMQNYVEAIKNYCCGVFSFPEKRHRRVTSFSPTSYYLAFNEYGHLIALSQTENNMQLKDSYGVLHTIQETDWKASFPVYVNYVHFAVLDGKYPIDPRISFKPLNSPNDAQIRTINQLSETINGSLKNLSLQEDLDTLVERSLCNHFEGRHAINLVRGEEAPEDNLSVKNGKITPEAKAYFVFFREKEHKVMSDLGIFIEAPREFMASPSKA
ncbi:hypothetical protein [Candidatus Protochlamydia phocaeensis]|uniref:hypothetical protein n=1 Tax=Candidatus Protochlamydia phocaeensis TaxID=1414722 RepID=UPI00083933F2|nr:hypothetical protein [Candidatus Protochlamydia phocaeensis]